MTRDVEGLVFSKAFHGCKHVELTDGDPIVVEALDEAVAKNHTNVSRMQVLLGGGFKYILCSPPFGEDFQFD